MLRTVVAALSALLLACSAPSQSALAAPSDFDRGVAIHDASVMRALDTGGFGIGSMLYGDWPAGRKMSNAVLAAMPEIQTIRVTLSKEFDDHLAALRLELCAKKQGQSRQKCEKDIGVDMTSSVRVFDKRFLTTFYARFQLVGIVNRMDRAFKTPDTCGEVRLLYRLNYSVPARPRQGTTPARGAVSSRLPMTLNVVLKARDNADSSVSCKEIASSWIWAGDRTTKGDELLRDLKSSRGPLRFISRNLIDRVEVNLQLDRWTTKFIDSIDDTEKDPHPRFIGGHADYLLRIFKRVSQPLAGGASRESYVVAKLENQVDRTKVLADATLKRRLRDYLLDPGNIKKIDDGTLLLPDDFLAERAISVTPGNFARSMNRPFQDILANGEIESSLNRLPDRNALKRVSTPMSFQHRLNDLSCTGCHQTRAVGGFHFMGHQWDKTLRANSIVVPASPHFFGDVHRRRHIVEAFGQDRAPDFSKGFSSRPDIARSEAIGRAAEFKGKGLYDGWGSHCHPGASSGRAGERVEDWGCAAGLKCKVPFRSAKAALIGVCMTDGKPKIGDPTDFGVVTEVSYGRDRYRREEPINQPAGETDTTPPAGSFWRFRLSDGSDGFAAGNVRTSVCPHPYKPDRKLPPEAACGAKPRNLEIVRDCLLKPGMQAADCKPFAYKDATVAQLKAYQTCLKIPGNTHTTCVPSRPRHESLESCLRSSKRTFAQCLEFTTQTMGIRACDLMNPCRDDYICTERLDPDRRNNTMPGACMPPYFLFQFRVDGHLNTVKDVIEQTPPPQYEIE